VWIQTDVVHLPAARMRLARHRKPQRTTRTRVSAVTHASLRATESCCARTQRTLTGALAVCARVLLSLLQMSDQELQREESVGVGQDAQRGV
jgi:hypothetical protein